jgi:hypothetical protein
MKPGQLIDIQFVNNDGEPVAAANILIDLEFSTKGNFRYRFGVGRTDESGRLTVSYADVEAIRKKNAEFDLMDYNTKLEQCDPQVAIVIDSEEELRERFNNALRSYKEPPLWAKNWPSNSSVRNQKKLVELVGPTTHAEIQSR